MRRSSFWIYGWVENIHRLAFVPKCRLGLISAVCEATRKEQIRALISLLHNLHQKAFASFWRTLISLASSFRLIRCFVVTYFDCPLRYHRLKHFEGFPYQKRDLCLLTAKSNHQKKLSYNTCVTSIPIFGTEKNAFSYLALFFNKANRQVGSEDINNYYWNNIPAI